MRWLVTSESFRVVTCFENCTRAWILARGKHVAITSADLELIECDTQTVREADIAAAQATGKRRPPATLTIPDKTRDLVWARDDGRCQFPGCRASRHLAFHHIRFREHGGSHDARNLLLLCTGHHKQLHDGLVTITGRAPDQLVFTRDGKRLVNPRAARAIHAAAELGEVATAAKANRFDDVVKLEEAKEALRQLGYKTRAAKQALEQARAHAGTDVDLTTLIKEALRHCCG